MGALFQNLAAWSRRRQYFSGRIGGMLKSIELSGFKSFGRKTALVFTSPIASIVGPNGSGKSNVAEAFRFVLGEQSMKSMRSKKGEDLIWGGSPALPRSNRASAKVTFDNTKRVLDIDFTEVTIERVVYRDGQNEYLLNGSQVRLKDVIRLLAGANIGGSGYQIISQGEADRILTASPRERREMVEDALGLKLYQHKKAESERKLEETANNLEKTRSLRREIAPHLRFLREQVEKLEKAREMREELAVKLREYLLREDARIRADDVQAKDAVREAVGALQDIEAKMQASSQPSATQSSGIDDTIRSKEQELRQARENRERLSRELGRAEGALSATKAVVEQSVAASAVRTFTRDIDESLQAAEASDDMSAMRRIVVDVRSRVRAFVDGLSGAAPETSDESKRVVVELESKLAAAQAEESRIVGEAESLRADAARERESRFVEEREKGMLEGRLREMRARLGSARDAEGRLAARRERFEDEVREGVVLIGTAMSGWQNGEIPEGALSEDQSVQDKRRRDVERLKIKIEEAGVGESDAVMREFTQTKERDEFLAREVADLEVSAGKLKDLIADLERTMDEKFSEGLSKINGALGHFFSKLFGGGEAKLMIEEPRRKSRSSDDAENDEEVVPEEDELYAGLSISVHLPRKKVQGLEVLSGGERALTSIALIFSMSQVNPPPFLILDETDAALDEANSRRYADMIRELGQKSQLIVITHNRATMAAAGELYGVTMGHDGVSQILSVKLEEAERVAK